MPKQFFQLFTVPNARIKTANLDRPLNGLLTDLTHDEHRERDEDTEMDKINDYEDSVNDKHWEDQ